MGLAYSFLREVFPPSPHFTVDSVPDQSGKVVLITGANAGIGKETARVLLAKNAKVWIACRDEAKGQATIQHLKGLTGRDAHLLKLDLSDLKSIKDSAEDFLRKEGQLHVLFNNAAIMHPPIEMVTKDGYDLQFGTNVLGHFYFTKLLLPLLISSAKSSTEGTVRVVNVASNGHWMGGLRFDTFKDGPKRRADSRVRLYGQSKTGNIVFSVELHKRYHNQGIVSISLNPGVVRTDLMRHYDSIPRMMIGSILAWDTSYGTLTHLYAGTAPEAAELGGQHLVPWARVGRPRQDTQDPQLGKELWTWLEEQVANI